jgi:hypothetical protein
MITATFERHGITYLTTGAVGSPQTLTMQHNGESVPLAGPLYFAAADAIAAAAQHLPPSPAPSPQPSPRPEPPDADTIAKAMEKVRKLLSQTVERGATPNEAAIAAARAQEIIDRFKLNLADAESDRAAPVRSEEPIQDFAHDPLNPRDTQLARWKGWLACCIAELNQCKAYVTQGRLALIGRASDVQVARYLFTWLSGEIERLAAGHCRGCGVSYWNNFRLGATETVIKRLKEQQQHTLDAVRLEAGAVSSSALALVNRNAALIVKRARDVEEWAARNMNLRKRSGGGRTRFNSEARERGRAAGHSINLRASGRLASSQNRLS